MCRRHGGNWRRLGPRGRRLWKPGPVDPPGQMLQMLEGPLPWEVKGLLWKSWEKATQWNHQKGRQLVTAATTTIPPSHRQHQHRLHHLSDILGFYPGCRKAWAHLKGPPRSTAAEATSFGEVTKEDGGLSTSTPVKALPPLSPPPPPPAPVAPMAASPAPWSTSVVQRNGQSLPRRTGSQLQHSGAGATPGDTAGPPAPGRGCLTTSRFQAGSL